MVLHGARPRGATDDPDRVLRSGGWGLLLAGAVLLLAVGLLFVGAGALAPLDEGQQRSWLPVALGGVLTVLGAALAVALRGPRPRRPLPAATVATGGGIALPQRRSLLAASVVGFAAVAGLGVLLVAAGDGLTHRVLGVAVTGFAAAIVVLLARSARTGAGAVVLTPESVTLPAGTTPRTTIAWRDLTEVAVAGGWQPHLVVTFDGPGLATTRLRGQAWPPGVILEVLEHFRADADARAELVAPAALDRFRG